MPVTLQDLGWNDHFQRAFDAVAKPGWMPGRLIRETKINFTALLDGGEDVDAVVSGKLWHDAATDAELPAVGDWVAIDPGEAGDEAVIRSILPRQTCFSRKAPGKSSAEQVLGTNVDIVAVVTEPGTDFNPRRMERYFTLIRRSGASPLILLNKTDLFSREEVEKAMQILRELSPECAIISISALHNRGITEFRKCLSKGKTICIVGSSGVGKSTLVNTLLGDEWLWTGEVNEVTGKGRHTTVARELVLLALLGALLLVTKLALAWLPNIEPVSLLVLVYTAVLGWKALAPVYVYVMMEILIWGLGFWNLCYTYVWLVLVVLAMLFRKMESPLGWAVLSGAFGLSFGALCALVYWVTGGWAFALSWWVSGIPFDLLHCAGNFAMALVLFRPCRQVLTRLMRT